MITLISTTYVRVPIHVLNTNIWRCLCGRDRVVVGFTTT